MKFDRELWRDKKIKDIKFFRHISDMTGLLYISEDKAWPTRDEIYYFGFSEGEKLSESGMLGLVDSREKFSLIDRIKLPYGYYANLYLYKMPELKRGKLSASLFDGRVKIFYKYKEVTKDMGIASSVEYGSKTYKYIDAVYSFYDMSPGEIKMISKWTDIGVTQSVSLTMDYDRIDIKIKLESSSDITLDAWYMNSLISDGYREWLRPFSEGTFKKISMFSDPYRFEPVDTGYSGPNVIGIKGEPGRDLPALLFRFFGADISIGSGISNTNYYHNARCVYAGSSSKIELKSGVEKYILDAKISILDNAELKKAIEDTETETQ